VFRFIEKDERRISAYVHHTVPHGPGQPLDVYSRFGIIHLSGYYCLPESPGRGTGEKTPTADTKPIAFVKTSKMPEPTDSSTPTPPPKGLSESFTLADFQQLIEIMYTEKDVARGVDGTFMWLIEEIGELASALRDGEKSDLEAEFADVLAWLTTIANVVGVDLGKAILDKYGSGCPGCGELICACRDSQKP